VHLIHSAFPEAVLAPVQPTRLAEAKHAFTTRRCNLDDARYVVTGGLAPLAGDLVLARVEKLGQHPALQTTAGRRATLFPGDEIVVVFGNRYAPDQFEAVVPADLGRCQLVAGGGVAAKVLSAHSKMKQATLLEPIGLLADVNGKVLNLRDYALPKLASPPRRPVTIGVVGTAMNAGKTTTAAHLVRGLRAAGLKVGAAKVTGTGAGGDTWLMRDAGATTVLDFTDAGFASTYKVSLPELCDGIDRILDQLAVSGTEVVVLEVGDGLLQAETAAVLDCPQASTYFNALVFAAQDAMGAAAGVDWLEQRGLRVEAVTGLLTAAPLASREAAEATGLPVLGLAALGRAKAARDLYAAARQVHDAALALEAGCAA
jgi:hypothetical protein